jgi:hypothetical protein
MNTKILISGAAAISLIATAALAQMAPAAPAPSADAKPAMAHHHHHMMAHHKAMESMESMGEYAPPAQPIPYSELATYKGDHAMGEHMMHKHMTHKHMDKMTDTTTPKS